MAINMSEKRVFKLEQTSPLFTSVHNKVHYTNSWQVPLLKYYHLL
jgi:hypothetical protein